MFVDRVQVKLFAGKGGDGCVSFRRERYVPRGGPDGGDGGPGGSIVVVAAEGVDSLAALAHRKFWKAPKGTHGSGGNRKGRSGEDLLIQVPPGTILIDAKNDFIMKDLANLNERVIAACGGKGGRGNTRFKSSTNRIPRQSTKGEEGEERVVTFELKVVADVGLVGRPNAGKSTLLSRLTRARPEIAAYPFTTKYPNLGRVQIDISRSFVMADIPGLIDGAHSGIGLGHEFLRHIERAGIVVHLIEPTPTDGSDPLTNYRSIRNELTLYNESLGHRPELIVVTKSELPGAKDIHQQIQEQVNQKVFLISAATGSGLNELKSAIVDLLEAETP